MKKKIVKELNMFLQGNYMAVYSYEQYIQKINDPKVKDIFKMIQKNHQDHIKLITNRVKALGGNPVNKIHFMKQFVSWMRFFTKRTTALPHIIKDAQTGEYRGIRKSQQMLEGSLDKASAKMVEKILDKDMEHVELLTGLLQSRE